MFKQHPVPHPLLFLFQLIKCQQGILTPLTKGDSMKNYNIKTSNHFKNYHLYSNSPYSFHSEIMEKAEKLILRQSNKHRKIFAFRMDVRFPQHIKQQTLNFNPNIPNNPNNPNIFTSVKSNEIFSKLIADLIKKIKANYPYSDPKYIWVKEKSEFAPDYQMPHYHILLLLNGSVIQSSINIYNYVTEIWNNKLLLYNLINFYEGLPILANGLIQYNKDEYGNFEQGVMVQRSHLAYQLQIQEVMRRASYLAKCPSKINDGEKNWYSSQC